MEEEKKPLIIIAGPTASGKTKLSVMLAKRINGAIIGADSIQIYKYMNIGSAKIRPEEMQGIPHYLIDELLPDEEFNIYRFKQMAKKAIDEIYRSGKIPIVAGGTGFYIHALLYDTDFEENESDHEYRRYLEKLKEEKGGAYLHEMLMAADRESACRIHPNNVKRVIRALEYIKVTNIPISEHNAAQKNRPSPYNFKYFVITGNRDEMYERIDKRVDNMIANGLENEVRGLLKMGYDEKLVSMQGLGYKEMAAYLSGKISLDEAIYIIKRDTRHLAKRQITWFKREKCAQWLDYENHNAEYMCDTMIEACFREGIFREGILKQENRYV